ncbi:MAG: chromate efflux transporter [Rhizobiales bacterium]|nr:chromate efflux transporter [Hyphomicrobiales bacterium]
MSDTSERQSISFSQGVAVWARIGLLSFGGPAGQIALMHRILVDEKKWLRESQFLHALNFCMLLPGPEAQQLATYSGWLLHGVRGGLAAGLLFILPGVVVMLALSMLYAAYADLGFVAALFFGIKAAVFAVVIEALLRISKRVLKSPALYGLAAISFVALFFFSVSFPLVILAAGLAGFVAMHWWPTLFGSALSVADEEGDAMPPLHVGQRSWYRALTTLLIGTFCWLAPVVALLWWLGPANVFTQQAIFFSKMAVVTFGGAYAVLAYVAQEAVQHFGWMMPGEMLDGLGLAETTPGPLIMVVQFVGFLASYREAGGLDPMLAGMLGALLTTWVTFAPCFLWIFLGAPYVEGLRKVQWLNAALVAITAAVVGVILNLAVWFGLHVIFAEVDETQIGLLHLWVPDIATIDWWALGLSAAAMIAMLRFHIGMMPVLCACAAAGLAISLI